MDNTALALYCRLLNLKDKVPAELAGEINEALKLLDIIMSEEING